MVRLTDRPDMTLNVYRGHKTTTQQQQQRLPVLSTSCWSVVDNTVLHQSRCYGLLDDILSRDPVSI